MGIYCLSTMGYICSSYFCLERSIIRVWKGVGVSNPGSTPLPFLIVNAPGLWRTGKQTWSHKNVCLVKFGGKKNYEVNQVLLNIWFYKSFLTCQAFTSVIIYGWLTRSPLSIWSGLFHLWIWKHLFLAHRGVSHKSRTVWPTIYIQMRQFFSSRLLWIYTVCKIFILV